MAFLAAEAGVAAADVLGWDAMFHDLTPPAVLGLDRSLLACPRIDNLLSCHAAVTALVAATGDGAVSGHVPVVCLFDHEEVGSASASGAGSTVLPRVLERISAAAGGTRDDWHRALAGSHCVSADGAHATHPNYADRHEPDHQVARERRPRAEGERQPALRHRRRERRARPGRRCDTAGVALQRFVTRTDLPCGSTIGPVTATVLGIPTVDVGVAQLSMHSARELCGAADPAAFVALLTAYLT